MAKKIQFGLSNVYYAKATIADDGSATYETPVRWPGAVNLNLSEEGEMTKFHADNIVYWQGSANNGYSGDFESALIPDHFKEDILGFLKDSNGVLLEDNGATGHPFALLFQFENDVSDTRYVLYNCVASRPQIEGSTKEDQIEPKTQTIEINCASIYVPAIQKNMVKGNTTEESDAATVSGWYDAVYVPDELSDGA